MILYDSLEKFKHKSINEELGERYSNIKCLHKSFLYLGIFSFTAFCYDIYNIGIANLAGDKGYVWENVSVFYIFSMWAALSVFTYAIKNKKYIFLFLSTPQILVHMFIGSRAYFAAMIIILLVLFRDNMKDNFRSNFRVYFAGGVSFMAIMVYRKIIDYLKLFDFETIKLMLLDKETYLWVLRLGEPRIVLANYNYVINSNFRLDFSDITARFLSIFPFANRIITPTNHLEFGAIIKEQLGAVYGLASTIWGEGHAMFGIIGIYIFYFLWIYLLKMGSDVLKRRSLSLYFIVPLVAYLSFYIHRLSFSKVIGNVKYLILTAIVWWLINSILTNNWVIISKRKNQT